MTFSRNENYGLQVHSGLFSCEEQNEIEKKQTSTKEVVEHSSSKRHIEYMSWEELKVQNSKVSTIVDDFNNNLKSEPSEVLKNNFSILKGTVQVIDQDKFKTYTFFVSRNNPEINVLENLTIKEYNNHTYEKHLLKYKYAFNGQGQKEFNSSVEIVLISNKGRSYRSSCTYEIIDIDCTENTVCTGGGNHHTKNGCICTDSPNTCDPAGSMSCTYIYQTNCSTGGGNTTTNVPNDEENETPPWGGGGSSTPDGTTTTTTSVPVEDPRPVWEPVDQCINGLVLVGGNDNTTIDPEILNQVKLNIRDWASIITDLNTANCSEEAQENAIDEIWEIFDEEICPDFEFETNPCFKSVYDDLGKASSFEKMLAPFAPTTSVANLRLSVVDSIIAPAGTISFGNQSLDMSNFPAEKPTITIAFNKKAFRGKSKFFVASVMIHELIHAEMERILLINDYSTFDSPSGTIFETNITEIINALNDHKKVEDLYTNWLHTIPLTDIPTDVHHEAMVNLYKETFKSALKEFDENQPDVIYEATFWMGLQHTKAWENLPENEKTVLESWRWYIIDDLLPKCD